MVVYDSSFYGDQIRALEAERDRLKASIAEVNRDLVQVGVKTERERLIRMAKTATETDLDTGLIALGIRSERERLMELVDEVEGPDAHEAQRRAFYASKSANFLDFGNGWSAALCDLRRRMGEEE